MLNYGKKNQEQRFSMDAFLTLLCFNFMAVNIIMSSEVRRFIASEVRYWWRSLTLQDRLYNWTGLWLDSAVRCHSRDVYERIEAHDPDLAALGWSELCGEWFWRMWRSFLCWPHFVSTNITRQYIPSLCMRDMSGKITYYPLTKCSCADIMWWLDLVKLLYSEPLAPQLQGFLPT